MTSVQSENCTLDFIENLLFACVFWQSRDELELCVKLSCDSLCTYEINLKAKPSISLLVGDVSFVILGENGLRAFSQCR